MSQIDRRTFLKSSAAVGFAGVTAQFSRAYAAGSEKIRVGVIGCGGRGRHDTGRLLASDDNVEVVAIGDLFADQVEGFYNSMKGAAPKQFNVDPDHRFVGWDAYKKVLASDIDMVVMTQTPHFRPQHLRAAVEAGKHIFMEKPIAVDPLGVRSVIESSDMADQKGLTIVAGTQMRRIPHLVEGMKRLHDGQIGEILSGQCLRLGGALMNWGQQQRQADWSDMEWHIRRWLFLTWLSGDFIDEQHVHNLDLVNWALGGPPVRVIATGGRIFRTDPIYGDVYDHMSAEYEYANGVKVAYMGSQIDGVSHRNDQSFVGTKGTAYMDFANVIMKGQHPWKYDGATFDPCIKQHADQLAAIRKGEKLNEGRRIAESTLTAILGRMSAYTGRALKYEWALKASKLDLTPLAYEWGAAPKIEVAIPGKTQLI